MCVYPYYSSLAYELYTILNNSPATASGAPSSQGHDGSEADLEASDVKPKAEDSEGTPIDSKKLGPSKRPLEDIGSYRAILGYIEKWM